VAGAGGFILMKLPNETSVHYPILLFVVMLGLATRLNPEVLVGMGRNSVWFIFICYSLVMLGVWVSLKVHALNGSTVLFAAGNLGLSLSVRFIYLVYVVFFIGMASIYIYNSGDFFSRVLLDGEPKTYIIFETILATAGALYPLKTHARYAHIMMVFVVPFFLAICLLVVANVRWNWLNPIFNKTEIIAPLHSVATILPIFAPLAAIILMRKGKEDINGASITIFTFVIALFTSYILAMGIATYGITRVKELVYFFYSTISAVRIENFVLERIVFIWMLYWKYIEIIGGAFFIRCAARAAAGIFGKRTSVLFVLGIGFLSSIIALLISGPLVITRFYDWMGYFSCCILIVMPAIIWLMLKIRGAVK
jgi:hypothetical protein